MWLILNNAFLSIVQDKDDASRLLVRARCRDDISRVFAYAVVSETPSADYAYRAFVSRQMVSEALVASVEAIDYTNFKNSVTEDWRHDAYMDVWSTLRRRFRGR